MTLMLALILLLATPLKADSSAVLDTLFDVGAKAIEARAERKQAKKQAAAVNAGESVEQEKRSNRMLDAMLGGLGEGLEGRSPSKMLAAVAKGAVDILLDDYKKQYQEEARLYARQLCDEGLESLQSNPKVSASLTALQVAGWSLAIFLTLVTAYLVWSINGLKREHRKVVAALWQLRESLENKD